LRNHLSLKELAVVLGTQTTYAGQAFDPALEKFARVFRRYPGPALALLADKVAELDRAEACRPMDESELLHRERMLQGGRLLSGSC